jgi:putative PIN family toxin of toxin-antitoxin system
MSPPKLVLDTNVVLDLVVFRDEGIRPLARALESGAAIAVTSHACLTELGRVLAYPQFKLDELAQSRAFEGFRARAALLDLPPPPATPGLPICADPDDQKFLELAWHANASCLVTKDRALLRLARAVARLGRFSVLHPRAMEDRFQAA